MDIFKPLYIVQELSARCYAGCPGCFRTFVKGPLDGDMSMETFARANEGIPPGTMVLPQFHGESLLHPAFPWFLGRYKELNLRVSMPVSGSAGFKHIPILVGLYSPVYILIVSIDGACDYSQSVRRGSTSLESASEFAEECLLRREGRSSPWIAVRWVEGEQSEEEFELYLKHWLFEKKVDFVLRSRLFNYGSKFNSPSQLKTQSCRSLCEGNPVVLFNGDVLLCERVPNRTGYVLGNVNKNSWEEIMAARKDVIKPCSLCSAAYVLTGFVGSLYLRHPENIDQEATIYMHSDHSQTFYSLRRIWSGINWDLK